MKIGIVGSGFVGQSLAKALTNCGHSVMLSSRDPQSERMQDIMQELGIEVGTVEETTIFGEIIAFALRWNAVKDVIDEGKWQGKIVVDMMNRFGSDSQISAGEELAKQLPDSHVVKALNSIGAEHYENPEFHHQTATMFIAGNDTQAKSKVAALLSEIGFDVVDAGNIVASKHLENLASFWVHLAIHTDIGRNFAFKLVRK